MRRLLRALLVPVLVLGAAGCGSPAAGCDEPGGACSRVLFIGNSYTQVNDLPAVFSALARSGRHGIEVSLVAEGGATLAEHAASGEALARIATGGWDVVVLQEQSQVPAAADARRSGMSPAARTLAAAIRAAGARPLLFVTWAHRDGWPERGLVGYDAMQRALDDGYLAVARELGLDRAPVGAAWREARQRAPAIELWAEDGSHPSAAGTYLAACVFYAAILGANPVGLGERSGIAEADAATLQAIAADVVLRGGGRDVP